MTSGVKIGYKVVRNNVNLEGRAGFGSAWNRTSGLVYEVGEWTTHKRGWGPLAVFDTLEAAQSFVKNRPSCVVYQCEYRESKETRLWEPHAWVLSGRSYSISSRLPQGTKFATSVKLVAQVVKETQEV